MFYSIDNFIELKKITDNYLQIISELKKAGELEIVQKFHTCKPGTPLSEHIGYWARESSISPEQIGYAEDDVAIVALPLFKKGFKVHLFDVAQTFPFLYQLLEKIPGVNFAAFFRLAPGDEVLEHAHSMNNLILHLCLTDLDGDAIITCNGEKRILRNAGDNCMFDYSKPHSSINHSSIERINLVIDFTPENN
jgi:aspartyl/asparaginyl beta-hydroxylase (cupin superfamily)